MVKVKHSLINQRVNKPNYLLLEELMTADQVRRSQTGSEESNEVDCQLVAVGDVKGQVLKQFDWTVVE